MKFIEMPVMMKMPETKVECINTRCEECVYSVDKQECRHTYVLGLMGNQDQ